MTAYTVQIAAGAGWRLRESGLTRERAIEFATHRQRAESPDLSWRVVGPEGEVWRCPGVIEGAPYRVLA